jgi:hypothetical protein
MFCDLAIVYRKHRLGHDPYRFYWQLLRELAKNVPVFAHHFFSGFHLRGEIWSVSCQFDAFGRFQNVKRVTLIDPQLTKDLLGQDDSDGVTHGGKLQRIDHECLLWSETNVITKIITSSTLMLCPAARHLQ